MATLQVGVNWTIRHVQAIIAVAAKESVLIGQLVSEELKSSFIIVQLRLYSRNITRILTQSSKTALLPSMRSQRFLNIKFQMNKRSH